MLTDGLEWCGLLWCFYQTLILTAPIHCRASIAETLMQRHISTNLMKKQTHPDLRNYSNTINLISVTLSDVTWINLNIVFWVILWSAAVMKFLTCFSSRRSALRVSSGLGGSRQTVGHQSFFQTAARLMHLQLLLSEEEEEESWWRLWPVNQTHNNSGCLFSSEMKELDVELHANLHHTFEYVYLL